MKKKKIDIMLLTIAGLFSLLFNTGCIGDTFEHQGSIEEIQTAIKLNINAPGVTLFNTRAMHNEATLNNVKILVFEELSTGNEVYRYEAPIEKTEGMTYTIKVKKSIQNEKFRLVVLANASNITLGDDKIGKRKEEILNQFTFDCVGKWNATPTNYKPLPMWGEAQNTMTIQKEAYIDILLHRALAKVDVGLRFKPQAQDNQTEEVEGLDNFKLTSVRVYRTKNKGYVASSADKINAKNELFEPNIHPDAIYNLEGGGSSIDIKTADEKPLLYEFAPTDSCVREIYIPESLEVLNDTHTMDDVPCLVIGGRYGTMDKETFYRVDFADYEANGVIKKGTYKTLLRNHRYVINIKSVSSPGFENPEHALNSISAKLELEVKAWNEKPMNYYVVGDYYFKINTRDVVLPADGRLEAPYDGFSIYYLEYETNLEVDESSFVQKWESSGAAQSDYGFAVFFDQDFATGLVKLIVGNLPNIPNEDEGITGEERSDVVEFTVDNKFTFTIKVKQEEYRNTKYQLLCESKVVNGLYIKGRGLTNSAYIDINVQADSGTGTLTGSPYLIETDTKNGIYFKAEGIYGDINSFILDDKGESYRVRLQGFGAPTNYAESTYRITCNSSSENGVSTCTVDIATAYRPIRILAISDNSTYGYGLNPEGYANSYNFVSSLTNFGPSLTSTVKVESVTITHTTDPSHFEKQLNNDPDIILCALSGSLINSVSKTDLKSYLDRGGVFICLHEHNFKDFINMLPGLSGASIAKGPTNVSIPIIGPTDMITNGSFGKGLVGKHWGATGTNQAVKMPDKSKVTVYSEHQPWGSSSANPIIFKHNQKNFFYCGDGGLLTNNARLGYGTHPFAVNASAGYTPMTAYYKGQTVYSAALFGNIMEWAMHQATYHGINK